MDIYVWGDLEFAHFVVSGISAMFSGGGSEFNKAAAILLILFFLWAWIKWSLNPDKTPYPVREMVFGIIFFMIFGGGIISPKFDVTLISERTGHARTVSEVPLLAAAPSWLATSFFRQATFVISDFFTIPGYETLRHDQTASDPLAVLVQLAEIANSKIVDGNIDRTIKEYISNCYQVYLSLSGSPHTNTHDKLLNVRLDGDIWATLAIDTSYLYSYVYGPGSIQEVNCTDVHSYVANQITSTVNTDFGGKALAIAGNHGIKQEDIVASTKLLNDHLAGTTAVNPLRFQVNLFLASTIKEGFMETPMSTWVNKMVFEAARKRTYEAAGERSMFMRIYIPTITAIEMFSFFIAPVMMILSVMGGIGFSLIGKYLMLVLFINLWGFIKIFVDLYTALSIRRAFETAAPSVDQPLLFQSYAQSILQVEDLLTVASNLTTAIPFFAMFLLYGGVHSVMGVMRTITGGSVDGSNSAPTMASTMNNGQFAMNDLTNTYMSSGDRFSTATNVGSNDVYGSTLASAGTSSLNASTSALIQQQQKVATQAFNESIAGVNQTMQQSLQGFQNASAESYGTTGSLSNIASLIDAQSAGLGQNNSSQAQILSRIAATLGAQAAAGASTAGGAEKAAKMDEGMSNMSSKADLKGMLLKAGLSADLSGQLVSGLTDTDVKSFAASYNTSKQDTTQRMSQNQFTAQDVETATNQFQNSWMQSEAYQTALSSSQQISNLDTAQSQVSSQIANENGLTSSQALKFHTVAPSYKLAEFEKWFNQQSNPDQQRMLSLYGPDAKGANDIAREESASNPNLMNDGAFVAGRMLTRLHGQDTNLNTTAADSNLAANLYRNLASYAPSDYRNSFIMAAEGAEANAKIASGVEGAHEALTKADTTKAEGASASISEGKSGFGPVKDTTEKGGASAAAKNAGLADTNGSVVQIQGASGKFLNDLLNDDKLKDIRDTVNGINMTGTRSTFGGANQLGQDIMGGVGSFIDLFKSREMVWGKDAPEISNNLAQYATSELGNKSLALESGITQLSQTSHFGDIATLFHKLNNGDASERYEAAQKISQMNDAYMFLNTKEGMAAITSAFNQEDGARLLHNAAEFGASMGFNTQGPLNDQTFDALSRARISGDITDNNADTFLKVHTGGDINMRGPNTSKTYDDGRALRYMLNDAPGAADNEDIRTLDQSIDKSNLSTKRLMAIGGGDAYRPDLAPTQQAVYQNIARDEDRLIQQYGGYTTDKLQGVNLENQEGVIQSATLNFVESHFSSRNADQVGDINSVTMERAFNGDDKSQQNIFGAVTTQGPLRIAERFDSLGFSSYADKIQYAYKDLEEFTFRTNLAMPREKLDSLTQNLDERIDNMPTFNSKVGRKEE